MRARRAQSAPLTIGLAALVAGAGARAQPAIPGAPREVRAGDGGGVEASRAAPDSPRACVLRFHDLGLRGRWVEAARYLDVPAASAAEGPRLARELSDVIDAHLGWDLDGLSGDALGDVDDGLPPRVDEVGEVPVARAAYSAVRVQRRELGDGARWVFTRATVLHVDE